MYIILYECSFPPKQSQISSKKDIKTNNHQGSRMTLVSNLEDEILILSLSKRKQGRKTYLDEHHKVLVTIFIQIAQKI